MQLMINILEETPEALRLAATFLNDHAALREAMESDGTTLAPTPSAPIPPPPAFVPPVPTGTPNAEGSNVIPFAPPVPTPPIVPPVSAGTPPAPSAPPVPPVPTPTMITSVTPGSQQSGALELDTSGMPWDARIHTRNKAKKKDGTWKLQKNIDRAIVATVTQELHARMINTPAAEVPGAASFPGSVPMPPASNGVLQQTRAADVPVPPVPTTGTVPPPPPAPPTQVTIPASTTPPVPVPPSSVLGVPDAGNGNVVQMGFRELVQKISKARADNKLTKEQLDSVLQQAGVPSLQLLGSMPHKVQEVSDLVDAALIS